MVTKKIDDLSEIAGDMETLRTNLLLMAGNAMVEVIEETIMTESVLECPHDTGTLRRSATVEDPKVNSRGLSVAFGYGTDYAAAVHEVTGNYHKPPTKAKFLEDPVLRHIDDFPILLADRIDAKLLATTAQEQEYANWGE
jgi:hypothetical protein